MSNHYCERSLVAGSNTCRQAFTGSWEQYRQAFTGSWEQYRQAFSSLVAGSNTGKRSLVVGSNTWKYGLAIYAVKLCYIITLTKYTPHFYHSQIDDHLLSRLQMSIKATSHREREMWRHRYSRVNGGNF